MAKKAWVICGIAEDEDNKLCMRMVSKHGWTTKREAERALKKSEHDNCFDPHLVQVNIA